MKYFVNSDAIVVTSKETGEKFYSLSLKNDKGIVVSHKGKSTINLKESYVVNAIDVQGIPNPSLITSRQVNRALLRATIDCTLRTRNAGEEYIIEENFVSAYNKQGKPIANPQVGQKAYVLEDGVDIIYKEKSNIIFTEKDLDNLELKGIEAGVQAKLEAIALVELED